MPKNGATMINLSPSTNKQALMDAMSISKLEKMPIKLMNHNNRALNYDGTPVGQAPSSYDKDKFEKNWVYLLKDGTLQYPTVDTYTSTIPGFCKRISNFWDLKTSNRDLFITLMKKIAKEFPQFNTNLVQTLKNLAAK